MGLRWQTRRRPRGVQPRRVGRERAAGATRLEPRGHLRGQGVLHQLGDRDPDARLSVVGRPRRLRRLRDDHEPDHGDDVPARPLRRGGVVRLGGRAPRGAADLGRARGRDDRRLLPAQPGADLDARRAQLPDRAPPLPEGAAHALPEDRARSCGATAPSTASATRSTRRSAARCARTSSICGRWAGSACRPRSRWGSELELLPERDELARVVGGEIPLDDRARPRARRDRRCRRSR